jgi:hypothetical protein
MFLLFLSLIGDACFHQPLVPFCRTKNWNSRNDFEVRFPPREGRKPVAFMNPRVIPTCIAFWPGEKELNLNIKHTTLEPYYNQLFLNLCWVSHEWWQYQFLCHTNITKGWWLLVKHQKPWSSCVCRLYIVLLHKLAIYCEYFWYILRATNFYIPGLRYTEKS